MPKEIIRLGDEIEDVVAKVRGIAHGRVEYLDGSVYWIIQPPAEGMAVLAKEVHSQDAYCKRIGDGVYLNKNRPPGFHVRELDDGR